MPSKGLDDLPLEILLDIAGYLQEDLIDLSRLTRVNRRLNIGLTNVLLQMDTNYDYCRGRALMWALNNQHIEMTKRILVLNKGIPEPPNSWAGDPFETILKEGHYDFVRTILYYGLDPLSAFHSKYLITGLQYTTDPVMRLLIDFFKPGNSCIINCFTMLHMACSQRRPSIARYMLENGANPNMRGKYSYTSTPLAYLLKHKHLNAYISEDEDDARLELIMLLLEYGAAVDQDMYSMAVTHSDSRIRYVFSSFVWIADEDLSAKWAIPSQRFYHGIEKTLSLGDVPPEKPLFDADSFPILGTDRSAKSLKSMLA